MLHYGFQSESLPSLLLFDQIDLAVGALTQLLHDLKHFNAETKVGSIGLSRGLVDINSTIICCIWATLQCAFIALLEPIRDHLVCLADLLLQICFQVA